MPLFKTNDNVLVLQGIPFDDLVHMTSDHGTWQDSFKSRANLKDLKELAAILIANQDNCPIIHRDGWQLSLEEGHEQFEIPAYMITEESILRAYERTVHADMATNAHSGCTQRLGRPSGVPNVLFQLGRSFAVSLWRLLLLGAQRSKAW